MNATSYLLLSTVCMSILYAAYRIILNKKTPFKTHRFFLLCTLLITLFLPLTQSALSSLVFYFTPESTVPETINLSFLNQQIIDFNSNDNAAQTINSKVIALVIYSVGAMFFILRYLIHIVKLLTLIICSEKKNDHGFTLVINHQFKNTFSFFKWIFIHHENVTQHDHAKIIAHEKIHASQYHSIDIMLIELLAAVMWFNPLVWKMKNSVQLIHEYLADEGALSTGIDRLKYQALLVNQITEERLICVASSFNHSLIKKRMIMMTKNKFNQKSRFRIFSLIPLALGLMFIIACTAEKPANNSMNEALNDFDKSNATYILDGEIVKSVDWSDGESIYSVDINKEANTITVITKAYQKANFETAKTLTILNGKEQAADFDMESIDQAKIKTLDVIKDQEQIKKYTDDNYDAVIVIEMQ